MDNKEERNEGNAENKVYKWKIIKKVKGRKVKRQKRIKPKYIIKGSRS